MITNGDEIKIKIRKMGMTLKGFAIEADLNYPYLINTLNGFHVYKEVLNALDKYGIKYTLKSRTKRKSAA